MLTLPIKKKWFDMILSGEKKEEYREHNDYYFTRFANLFGFVEYNGEIIKNIMPEIAKDGIQEICFRNGYSSSAPFMIAKCSIRLGKGKEEWGAEPEKEYYILTIYKIVKKGNLRKNSIKFTIPEKILWRFDNILDKGLHHYQWSNRYSNRDSSDESRREYLAFRDIATYMFSKFSSIDKETIATAIEVTAKGYSKGNQQTEELTRLQFVEKLEDILDADVEINQSVEENETELMKQYMLEVIDYTLNAAVNTYRLKEECHGYEKKVYSSLYFVYYECLKNLYLGIQCFDWIEPIYNLKELDSIGNALHNYVEIGRKTEQIIKEAYEKCK